MLINVAKIQALCCGLPISVPAVPMPASLAAYRPPRHVRWWRALKAALGGSREPPYLEALDAIDAAVVLFDAQDRLRLRNRNFCALYPGLSHGPHDPVRWRRATRKASSRSGAAAPAP